MGASVQPRRRLTRDEYQKLRTKFSDADIRQEFDVPEEASRQRLPSAAPADAVAQTALPMDENWTNPVAAAGISAADAATLGIGKHLLGQSGRDAVRNARESLRSVAGKAGDVPEYAGYLAGTPLVAAKLAQAGLGAKAAATTIGAATGAAAGENAKGAFYGGLLGGTLGLAGEHAAPYIMQGAKWTGRHLAKFSEGLRERYGTERAAELARKVAGQMFPGSATADQELVSALTPGHGGIADAPDALGINLAGPGGTLPLATQAREAVRTSEAARQSVNRGVQHQMDTEGQRITSAVEAAFAKPHASVQSVIDDLRLPQTPHVEALVLKALGQTDANAPLAMDQLRRELVDNIQPRYEPHISQHSGPITDPEALSTIQSAERLMGHPRKSILTAGENLGKSASEFLSEVPPDPRAVAESILDSHPMTAEWRTWKPQHQQQAIEKTITEINLGMHKDAVDAATHTVPTGRYALELKQRAGRMAKFGGLPGETPTQQTTAALRAAQGRLGDISEQAMPGIADIDAQYAQNQADRTALVRGARAASGTPEDLALKLSQSENPALYRKGMAHRILQKIRTAKDPLAHANAPAILARLRAGAVDPSAVDALATRARQVASLEAGGGAMGRTPQELAGDLGQYDPTLYKAGAREQIMGDIGGRRGNIFGSLFGTPNQRNAVRQLADNPVPLEKAIGHEDVIRRAQQEVALPGSHPETETPAIAPTRYSIQHAAAALAGNPKAASWPVAEALSHAAKTSLNEIEREAYTQLAPVYGELLASGKSAAALQQTLDRAAEIMRQRGMTQASVQKVLTLLGGVGGGAIGGALGRQ